MTVSPDALYAARSALEDELEYRSPKGTMTSWDELRIGRMLAREPVLAREIVRLAEAALPSANDVNAWVRTLCKRAGIRVHLFTDGSTGLVDVPVKYAAVIEVLNLALLSIARGDGLPQFAPIAAVRAPKKARRR